MLVLGFAVAAIAFGVATLAYDTFGALHRRPTEALVVATVGPALAGTFLPVSPTGLALLDAAYLAGAVAALALLASMADRRIVLAAAAVTTTAAVLGGRGVAAGAAALGVALAATGLGVRLTAHKALAGGMLALALLDLRWPDSAAGRGIVAAVAGGAVVWSAWRRSARQARRPVLIGVGAAAGFAAIACGLAALQAVQARDELERAVDAARSGLAFARTGDVERAAVALSEAEGHFATARGRLDGWASQPVRLVPGAAQNQQAIRTMARSGSALTSASTDVAAGFDLDTLRLRHGRLDLDAVVAVRQAMASVAGVIHASEGDLEDVDSPALVGPVADALQRFQTELIAARRTADTTVDVLRAVPDIFGGSGTRHLFLGVLATSEARASGGIIGSHGILTLEDGEVRLGDLSRTSDLNAAGDLARRAISGPPEFLERYGRYDPARTWQNVTMSPDGPTIGAVIEELYPQSGGIPIDGSILVDHATLAAVLRLIGPVTVDSWHEPLTAQNISRVLLHEQYVVHPVPERVDFLADTARAVFDRLTTSDLPGPREVLRHLGEAAEGRHLALHSADPDEQDLFATLGLDGALPHFDSDFLGLVTQNASGNKIDWFLERSLRYDAAVDEDGTIDATAEVELRNAAPTSGLPDYIIGGAGPAPSPRGTNRLILSLYTPLELVDATLGGQALRMRTERELGRNVHEVFIDIPSMTTVTVQLRLRGAVEMGRGYSLRIWGQPVTQADAVKLRIRGPDALKVDSTFELRHDALVDISPSR